MLLRKIDVNHDQKHVTLITEEPVELKENYEDQLALYVNRQEILASIGYPSLKNFNKINNEYTLDSYINI